MSRASFRQGWWIVVAVAVTVSMAMNLALRQSQVSGEENGKTTVKATTAADTTPTKTPEQLKSDPSVIHAKALSQAFREAASVASPSVVRIDSHESAKKVKGMHGQNFTFKGTPFGGGDNPFKGTPFENMIPDGQDFNFQSPPHDGMGTGVIIDKSGIVLTNNHVVDGADTVTVHFSDGREYKATDIKTDPQSDLAVLRIKADGDLPAAHLGNSDDMEIGDWVIAIGNPFGQEKTVTAGIISGKGRELDSSQRTKYLQTDAAINPGNSGGPLVNLDGEVVGINTAIASNSGGYQGIGFAIPINQAKWVTEQLVKTGSVHRGYLGVAIGEMTSDLAAKFGGTKDEGVLVSEVFPKTPAANAKMQEGDIIVKFAGKEVHNPREAAGDRRTCSAGFEANRRHHSRRQADESLAHGRSPAGAFRRGRSLRRAQREGSRFRRDVHFGRFRRPGWRSDVRRSRCLQRPRRCDHSQGRSRQRRRSKRFAAGIAHPQGGQDRREERARLRNGREERID